eukprot:CAMPEP_0204222568 /NCGR_PEP_ID=MMETSP0361-20130328/82299_1 /ASSEMBLY_ACC=CAM_ASM_000343 /TAXON_ID=268821 /ORGANISM="Scrippsiella Hangoei, Strain SHTV-5" /LENGTH=44 /DNA_ID= /DNA_START= /DNA_END= /DNA_ORIENTATION=
MSPMVHLAGDSLAFFWSTKPQTVSAELAMFMTMAMTQPTPSPGV